MKLSLPFLVALLALFSVVSNVRAQSAAREAGYLYLSPVPDAPYTSPQTRFVLVRFENVSPEQVTNLTAGFITVSGASSGVHSGSTHVASDGRTVIFEMTTDFAQSELVTVTLNPQLAAGTTGVVEPFEYQFMINGLVPGTGPITAFEPQVTVEHRDRVAGLSAKPFDKASPFDGPDDADSRIDVQSVGEAVIMPNGVSVPSDFPEVVISVNNNPSPGYIFVNNVGRGDVSYSMMLDNNGLPVWYGESYSWQFAMQENGTINWLGVTLGYDQNFNYVRSYHTANGYLADGHELEVLADGAYVMLGVRHHTVDMTRYFSGAKPSANFTETVIQEFTPSGELIFQWRGWDNYDVRDIDWGDPLAASVTFPHINAIDVDEDGHILVSARSASEVTKINRDTGEVIWRLSGARSSFTFVNDPLNGFSCQHDITGLGNNRYMVFDNGNWHNPRVSRAVEYQLDLTNMTASMVWEFRDSPDKHTTLMGNAQRLPTSNTLINFVLAKYPTVVEVDSNGVKRFEMDLLPAVDHYRVFRFPWTGVVAVPYLIVEPRGDNVTLIFNKFGDHSVDHYRIYGGTAPSPTTLVGTSTTTLKRLTNVVNGTLNYFRVTAVDTNGIETDFSNEESLLVNLTLPGDNMVRNGDFAQGSNAWTWTVTPPASAQLNVTGGAGYFAISSGGGYITDVQLSQSGMALTRGKEYTLSFDAWSAAPRIFEAKVEQNTEIGINYSGIQPLNLIPSPQAYSFTFTMNHPTDGNARLVFNGGVLPHDVFIDNISLTERVYAPGDLNWDGCVGYEDLQVLTDQWKEEGAGLTADLNGDSRVDFADYAILSANWSGEGVCP